MANKVIQLKDGDDNLYPIGTILLNRGIKSVHTVVSTSGTAINAHGGVAKSVTVAEQTGYSLLAHVACWHSGVGGIIGGFDANSTTNTVSTYLNNTTNNAITISSGGELHVTSLFVYTG